MNGAFGWNRNSGKPADEPFADFSRTPAGVLSLHVQHIVFYLKGKFIRVSIRTSASIGEPLNAAFLVAIENLVAGLAGDPKLSAKFRHRLPGQPAGPTHPTLPHTTTHP